MLAIADASPIHYLLLIGHMTILPSLYDQIIVPEVVVTELQHPQTPETVRVWIETRPGWLDVRQPRLTPSETMGHLGAGERDAILLFRELAADVVLMDDLSGRAEASRQRVVTTGTLGLLETASLRGLLDLPVAVSRLLTTNFRVAQAIIDDLLARDAERRGGTGTP